MFCVTYACLFDASPFTCIRSVLTWGRGWGSFEHSHCYLPLTSDLLIAPPTPALRGNTCLQCCEETLRQKVETLTKTSQRTSGKFNLPASLWLLPSLNMTEVKSARAIRELKVLITRQAGCVECLLMRTSRWPLFSACLKKEGEMNSGSTNLALRNEGSQPNVDQHGSAQVQ